MIFFGSYLRILFNIFVEYKTSIGSVKQKCLKKL